MSAFVKTLVIFPVYWFSLSMVFLSSPVIAALKAPDFTLHSEHRGYTWLIVATAPPAHHFNTDAPMSLKTELKTSTKTEPSSLKPELATANEVRFKVPETLATRSLKISLFLCDDAKTFCEKHEIDYNLAGSTAREASELSESSPDGVSKTISKPAITSHGFIVNDPDKALEEARREKKPLMIDFFGIWCPPCNELDEKVFSTSEFTQAAAEFVRLKLDSDSAVSWKLKSLYQISGYPTVIFASAEGDEISRIVGYRPAHEFIQEMNDAWQNQSSPLQKLEKRAASGDRAAADRAGVIRYNRGESQLAAKLLTGTVKYREFWHLAEIDAMESGTAPVELQISRLRQAIAEFPATPNTLDWFDKLSNLYDQAKDDEKRRVILSQAMDLATGLAKHPDRLTGYDATPADLLESKADFHERLDGNTAARPDWLAAALAYQNRGVGDTERANNLEMSFCLGKAGEVEKARTIYERLERAYPKEFTFYYAHARMEFDRKNLDRATALAKISLDHSYGDNRLRATLLMAQIYQALGDKPKTKLTLDETLKSLSLPSDAKLRTHRYATELQKLRASLN
jgi:thioredoxin-like negative regulator of GroEL